MSDGINIGRDNVKATIALFCDAVSGSADAPASAVSEALRGCREAHAAWVAAGAAMPAVEPVLQAANAVLDAVYEINPEGLPFAYRDMAAETQAILDEAAEQGFQVTALAVPTP